MNRCLDCAQLTNASRCPACERRHEVRRSARRGPSGWARQRASQLVIARDGGRCQLCGAPATEVDHRIRLADGGSDASDNKRALCRPCHQRVTSEATR
jgi:5-methylcytosine-specific restriction endonuclease McrA